MTRLRIQTAGGELELDSVDFENDLKLALSAMKALAGDAPGAPQKRQEPIGQGSGQASANTPDQKYDHGINTYAAKFGSDSGRKILRTAALHLSLVDGRETFSRVDLVARAREGREWKKGFVNTQANDLRRMVASGELIERANGMFSVPTKGLEEAMRELEV